MRGCAAGRVRDPRSRSLQQKLESAPLTKQYVFFTDDGWMIDPTDMTGLPCKHPAPGLPWFPVNVMLAYVNEPSAGQTINVTVAVDGGMKGREVMFTAQRNIKQGEELFIDYGPKYDRSMYRTPEDRST